MAKLEIFKNHAVIFITVFNLSKLDDLIDKAIDEGYDLVSHTTMYFSLFHLLFFQKRGINNHER